MELTGLPLKIAEDTLRSEGRSYRISFTSSPKGPVGEDLRVVRVRLAADGTVELTAGSFQTKLNIES